MRELRNYASRVDLDPQALRDAEARIEALHAAGRKYRVRPEELPARLAELQKRLAELELAVNPEALKREVAAAQGRYESVARKLSAKRRTRRRGARQGGQRRRCRSWRWPAAVSRFLSRSWKREASQGAEEVEFEVASHPSLPLRPLAKVASGGELSRVSLAIQLVAASASPVGALVFDEIDSGIGGAVAETIGKALRQLGKTAPGAVRHPPAAGRGERQRPMVGTTFWSEDKTAAPGSRCQNCRACSHARRG